MQASVHLSSEATLFFPWTTSWDSPVSEQNFFILFYFPLLALVLHFLWFLCQSVLEFCSKSNSYYFVWRSFIRPPQVLREAGESFPFGKRQRFKCDSVGKEYGKGVGVSLSSCSSLRWPLLSLAWLCSPGHKQCEGSGWPDVVSTDDI